MTVANCPSNEFSGNEIAGSKVSGSEMSSSKVSGYRIGYVAGEKGCRKGRVIAQEEK